MRHFWSDASKCVIGPAPLLPATMFAQVVSTSPPSGVTRPSPVTTTRRISISELNHFFQNNRPKPVRAEPVEARKGYTKRPSKNSGRTAKRTKLALMLFNVLVGVADRVDLLGRIVGNLDAELFLEGHHQLDDVEAVGAQIVDEARVGRDLVFFDAQVLDNDLLNAVGGIAHLLPSRIWGFGFGVRPNERRARWQVPWELPWTPGADATAADSCRAIRRPSRLSAARPCGCAVRAAASSRLATARPSSGPA